jgi:hypothetical protein
MSTSDPPPPGFPATGSSPQHRAPGSRPARRGRLKVGAPGARISVVTSGYQPVATATGQLSIELPVGAYRATAQVGGSWMSSLAVIRADEDTSLKLPVVFPAAAPAAGTASVNPGQQDLVRTITQEVSQSVSGPPAALVLVLRNLSDEQKSSPKTSILSVFDGEMRPVIQRPAEWKRDNLAGAAGWSKRLNPGGYVLRIAPPRKKKGAIGTDQAVWLSPGWMTVVFIPTGPDGPRSAAVSVQMVKIGSFWKPDEEQAFAAEAILAGLRDGDVAVDDAQLRDLLHAKFVNPMLGVLGGHAVVQQMEAADDPDVARDRLGVLRAVVANLTKLIGDHPDVAALRAVARMADGHEPSVSVTWPPMLAASLHKLIGADRVDQSTLPAGSPAEQIPARCFMSGPWLLWEPTADLALRNQIRYSQFGVRLAQFWQVTAGSGPWHSFFTTEPAGFRRGESIALREVVPSDDAVLRCEQHLAQTSRLLGTSTLATARELGTAELSRRLTMPMSLVEAALRELARNVGEEETAPFALKHKSWAWHRAADREARNLKKQDPWGYGQLSRTLEQLTAEIGGQPGHPGKGRIKQVSAPVGGSSWIVLFVERRDSNGLGGLVLQRSARGKKLPDSAYETARHRLSETPGW